MAKTYTRINQINGTEIAANRVASHTEGIDDQPIGVVISGTQTAVTSAWTGKAPFTTLEDNQIIYYYLPYSAATGTNVTLNLTLSDGTTTGAKAVYFDSGSNMKSKFEAGSIVPLIFKLSRENSAGSTLTNTWMYVPDASSYCTSKNMSIPFFTGTGTAAKTSSPYDSARWIYNGSSEITLDANGKPADGTTICVRVPVAGNGTYGTGLSLDNGVNYYPVCANVNTMVSTRYAVNASIILTFNSTQSSKLYNNSDDDTTVTGVWQIADYDANTNTIGYQIRSNSASRVTSSTCKYYKIFFSSADDTKWVPACASTTNSATSAKTVITTPINPFGPIVYNSSTSTFTANTSVVTATTTWQQYLLTLGYSFNRTGAALTLTANAPVYIKCAPQADGSAIIDATTPYVQALPSSNDGKIYIFLGFAYNATQVELRIEHPVYYHDGTALRLWTGADGIDITAPTTNATYPILLGNNTTAAESNVTSIKKSVGLVVNPNKLSVAEGSGTTASGECSHAEGNGTTASGNNSHAEGENTTSYGEYSHAEGKGSVASGGMSHTEGSQTIASGDSSHAEGVNTTADGEGSHAEGFSSRQCSSSLASQSDADIISNWEGTAPEMDKFTLAKRKGSHVEGINNLALGEEAHAEGNDNIAVGTRTHVEGASNVALEAAHVEGEHNIGARSVSHTEGGVNFNYMYLSHAEGSLNTIIPTQGTSNQYGHVEGSQNKVTGNAAHAEGGGNESITITDFSSYNKISDTQFSFVRSTNIGNLNKITHVYIYYGNGTWDYYRFPVESITKSGTTYTVVLPSDVYIKNVVSSCKKLVFYYYSNLASGDYSHAEGSGTTASGAASHAEGYVDIGTIIATSGGAHAGGFVTGSGIIKANGDGSHAGGYADVGTIETNNTGAHAEGYVSGNSNVTASGPSSLAFGSIWGDSSRVESSSDTSVAIGNIDGNESSIVASSDGSVAIGCIEADNSIIEASGTASHAEGYATNGGTIQATSYGAHAEGYTAYGGTIQASASGAHAEGYTAYGGTIQATSQGAHAEGYAANGSIIIANGEGSHAEGVGTTASGYASHAEGQGSLVQLSNSNISERKATTITFSTLPSNIEIGSIIKDANGAYARVTNINTSTKVVTVGSNLSTDTTVNLYVVSGIASGDSSHAEGGYTTASGEGSHAEGYSTTASGDYSHAEGDGTTASHEGSHAEGGNTTASGDYSHAGGNYSIASGDVSFAFGDHVTANTDNSFVIGTYNGQLSSYDLFAIGNGRNSTYKYTPFRVSTDSSSTESYRSVIVTVSGKVNASAGFYQTSDINKKNVIGDLDLDKAYELIDKCQTILYTLKDDESNKQQVGLIAQEVNEFFPELITEDENGVLSLDYSRLTVIILKVLKDVIDRVKKLESK